MRSKPIQCYIKKKLVLSLFEDSICHLHLWNNVNIPHNIWNILQRAHKPTSNSFCLVFILSWNERKTDARLNEKSFASATVDRQRHRGFYAIWICETLWSGFSSSFFKTKPEGRENERKKSTSLIANWIRAAYIFIRTRLGCVIATFSFDFFRV